MSLMVKLSLPARPMVLLPSAWVTTPVTADPRRSTVTPPTTTSLTTSKGISSPFLAVCESSLFSNRSFIGVPSCRVFAGGCCAVAAGVAEADDWDAGVETCGTCCATSASDESATVTQESKCRAMASFLLCCDDRFGEAMKSPEAANSPLFYRRGAPFLQFWG